MRYLTSLLLCIGVITANAQQLSPYAKFGKITVEDLRRKVYPVDSGAHAIVLSDIGEAEIVGNNKASFSIKFNRHRVVHILDKNGYDEAEMRIRLFTRNGAEEKLDGIKGITYNLENGKMVETKLNKSEIFKEKESEHWVAKKFTMPAVREGSIIELEYSVISDFIDILDPWEFQGSSPVLWSEYKLSVPQFFTYSFLSHGYHPMAINERSNRVENFTVRDTRSAGASETAMFSSGVTDYRWAMTNVEAIREENFTSAIKNHLSSIDFQLISVNPPLTPKNFRGSWTQLTNELLESENFGKNLETNNMWLSDDVKTLVIATASDMEKAKKLFTYVRDNFSCNKSENIYLSQSLKNVFKSRKGSIADLNLLLTAMLNLANIKAEPVLLSTTGHGYVMEGAPMITAFNYVVSKATIGEQEIFLDAAHPRLGFAKLLPECYNGNARVVNKDATALRLDARDIRDVKTTSLFISNKEKGGWTGLMNQNIGYYESIDLREDVHEKGLESFFKEIEKKTGTDVKLISPRIDSLTNYEEPVSIHYELELPAYTEDILYINPMFGEGYSSNPFTAAQRYYPVEMPFTADETYNLTLEVPNGYVVDELPKQLIAKLDEKASAYFEYRISLSGSTISLRSRIKIDKTLFLPDEYENLREFFNLIVSKQKEQIVFKKKK
jgi:transglutaminase-like putative cysteine protease